MSQASNSNTPNRVSFSSAGAVRRRPSPQVLSPVQLAHHGLIAALARETPHNIVGTYSDRFDIMNRADHLENVLAAVTAYAKVIVADTAENAPLGYVADETGFLADAAADIVGALKKAVDRMIDDANEAA